MQGLGHFGAVQVEFTTASVLHKTHELQFGAVEFGIGLGMEGEGFAGKFFEAETSHSAGGAGKGQINQISADTDRFKNLGAMIARKHRNADFGENFSQTVFKGLAHVLLNLDRCQGR